MQKICEYCHKDFDKKPYECRKYFERKRFCSSKCFGLYQFRLKGIRNSGKTRFKKGYVSWNKGLKGYRAAEKSHLWKGGVTPEYHKIRNSLEYKNWRIKVFERDEYKCVMCGSSKSGTLNADHIRPFALYPELRLDINNGRTLCINCHKKTESYMNRYITRKD